MKSVLKSQKGFSPIIIALIVVVGIIAVVFIIPIVKIEMERRDPSCAWDSNTTLMYGEKTRCPWLKKSDDLFIKQELEAHSGNKDLAAVDVSLAGRVYFYHRDYDTAMKRFNQAWLLDQEGGDTYWNFAVLLYKQGKLTDSKRMLDKAFSLLKNDEYNEFNCDLIFQSELTNENTRISKNDELYKKTKQYLNNSPQKLDSNSCQTVWGMNYYLMGENTKALEQADLAKKNGANIPQEVIDFFSGKPSNFFPELNAAQEDIKK